MNTNRHDDDLAAMLRGLALARMGLRADAVRTSALHGALRALLASGWNRERIARGTLDADERILSCLARHLTVAETYFFRGPEAFVHVAAAVREEAYLEGETPFRAWSAGCATGEEAYSLAATLLQAVPQGASLDILGTDLVEVNVGVARRGRYEVRATRKSVPMLHPVLDPAPGLVAEVRPEVKAVTRFAVHDLLDPPPEIGFDLVLCRNVLIYLSPAAGRRACRHLVASLAPGGVLLFGPMDIVTPPEGLERVGPPELQMYRRPHRDSTRAVAGALPPRPRGPEPAAAPLPSVPGGSIPSSAEATELVAEHLRVLELLELRDDQSAKELLWRLCERAPNYIPGLVERARILLGEGERHTALRLFQQALERATALDPDEVLAGPSPLPASFYRRLVQTYLQRHGVSR